MVSITETFILDKETEQKLSELYKLDEYRNYGGKMKLFKEMINTKYEDKIK